MQIHIINSAIPTICVYLLYFYNLSRAVKLNFRNEGIKWANIRILRYKIFLATDVRDAAHLCYVCVCVCLNIEFCLYAGYLLWRLEEANYY